MIKKVFSFVLLLLLSIAVLITMFTYSNRKLGLKNGFKRIFPKDRASIKAKITLDDEAYSIVDVSTDTITLNTFNKPYELIKISNDGHKKITYRIPSIQKKEKFDGLNTVAIFDDCYIILSGKSSSGYKINKAGKIIVAKRLNKLYFYQSEVMNTNSFVFVEDAMIDSIKRHKLKKVNWQGKELSSFIPEKQVDGYFCTDGFFTFDRESKRLFYAFYYRGTFACLDSNLNLIYQAKTIDTIKRAKIFLRNVGNHVTQSTPPNVVNKRFSVANGKVYMQSALKADNETKGNFEKFDVIDIYNIRNGEYTVSFYIPKLGIQRLTAFKVYKHMLVALYNSTLVVFKIPNF